MRNVEGGRLLRTVWYSGFSHEQISVIRQVPISLLQSVCEDKDTCVQISWAPKDLDIPSWSSMHMADSAIT